MFDQASKKLFMSFLNKAIVIELNPQLIKEYVFLIVEQLINEAKTRGEQAKDDINEATVVRKYSKIRNKNCSIIIFFVKIRI